MRQLLKHKAGLIFLIHTRDNQSKSQTVKTAQSIWHISQSKPNIDLKFPNGHGQYS